MSSAYKQSRKEILEPDQFLKTSNEYIGKAAANGKKIVTVFVSVLVVALAVALVSSYAKSKSEDAGEAFSQALALTSRPVSDAIGADTVKAFPSTKAKMEALERAFQKVMDEHGGTVAAISASYYLADAKFQLGKYEEASKLYATYLEKAGGAASMKFQAMEGQAYAAEAMGDGAKAHDLFTALADQQQDDTAKARAKFNAARALEVQGKKAEAAEAYQKVVNDFTGKAYGVTSAAQERLALLASQGITPKAAAEGQQGGK